MASKTVEQKAFDRFTKWKLEPRQFVIDAFGMDGSTLDKTISKQQLDGLEKYRRVLVAKLKRWKGAPMSAQEKEDAKKLGLVIHSGHGCGKTAMAAWIMCHFLTTRAYCKIAAVAPVGPQLKANLWPEIALWLRKSTFLKDMITWQAEKVFFTESEGREWFAIPRSVNVKASADEQAETLAGLHNDNLLIIADEASGIPPSVFRPLEGALTGPVNLCLLIGNPTRGDGFFYDSFTKYRHDWLVCHWNSEESELVQKSQVERMAKKYGRDSNAYRIRVLGLPPTASPDTLIPYDWVMNAVNRDLLAGEHDAKVLGVDVARYGDDKSIIMYRHGPLVGVWNADHTALIGGVQEFQKLDNMEMAYHVAGTVQEREAQAAAIDVIGWGSGTYDRVKELAQHIILLPVNVGERADNPDQFMRKRDEMWWAVRDRFEQGTIAIPEDDELIGELTTIRYNFQRTAGEKVKIESKQELRDRGLASPNKADALCLTEEALKYCGPLGRRPARTRSRLASAWVG